jgi:hypothetical protein
MEVLREYRSGRRPGKVVAVALPTLRGALVDYCAAKRLKSSSQKRYDSIFRTHFPEWLDRPFTDLGAGAFAEHCHAFANGKMRISAIVDACFRLIMDGVSASSWTRRDARKRGLNVAQTPRLTAAKCDREALGFDFGLLSWGSLSIGPCQAAGGPPPERYRVTDFVGNLIRSSK